MHDIWLNDGYLKYQELKIYMTLVISLEISPLAALSPPNPHKNMLIRDAISVVPEGGMIMPAAMRSVLLLQSKKIWGGITLLGV